MNYDEKLKNAVEFAKNLMSQGVDFYNATEWANEEFDVSICDIQKQINYVLPLNK